MVKDSSELYRLPRMVLPSRYVLGLAPDLDACTFTGQVSIDIQVTEPVGQIVLNAADLDITAGDVDGTSVADICYDPEHERVVLQLQQPISVGESCLTLSFTGTLNDQLRGFYRSSFTDTQSQQRLLATTQFESTSARRAFPCWDEPDFKAIFEVSLTVAEDMLAVSSGSEVASNLIGDGLKEVIFAPTMKMSTYLLAFVVGPLQATKPVNVNGTPLRVIHPLGKDHLVDFALDVGAFCLDFFEDYFDIAYPGDKLDLVAIPDFAFGAMENMGCVTFREVLLLLDPENSTQQERQTAADVIAHELAHMWFGNLVTMKWWNGIWLKEAFATFCEMLAVDAYQPEWKRWLAFGLLRTAAFDVDSLSTTRAIEYPVVSPVDAEGMYDLLTYEKGAATVRMLEQFLGAEQFRSGVRQYLNEYSYSSTETHHLWDSLAKATAQPVRSVMETWIFQGGHPQVTVSINSQGQITLNQKRFEYADSTQKTRWQIPVVIVGANNYTERLVLDGVATLNVDPTQWVMLNPNADGFYRVAYQDGLLERLLQECSQLTPQQRYVLADDQWALTVAQQLSVAEYLAFAKRVAVTEDDLTVWRRLTATFATLDHLVTQDGQETLRQQVRNMTGPAVECLGWERTASESDRISELRGVLMRCMAAVGNDFEAIQYCQDIFATTTADPALEAAALAVVATTGDSQHYEEIWSRRATAPTPQMELRYLTALSLFSDSELLERTLQATLDDTIRSQDAGLVLRGCLENRELGTQAWDFVKQNWQEITTKIPSQAIPRMLGGICALSTPEGFSDVTAFLDAHPVEQGPLIVAQHLERLKVNVALRQRVQQDITTDAARS